MAPRTRRDAQTPKSAARAGAALARADGWENVFTGHGTARDKRRGSQVSVMALGWADCEALYRGDDMAAKIVEEPANEATRRWFDVQIQDDRKTAEAVERQQLALRAELRFQEAMAKARAYGGAGIIVGIDDGVADPAMPVNERAIRAIRFLTVFDAFELAPRSWYADPFSEKYGQPETYYVQVQGFGPVTSGKPIPTVVHETRVLRFDGVKVSRRLDGRNRGWGDSVFVRVIEVLSDFGLAWGGAGHLLSDFSQAVLKIRGLTELMAAGKEDVVRKRLEAIEMGRSVVRAAVIDAGSGEAEDAGESFERKATPLSGYPEMLDRFMTRLAAAADMPVSRLFGVAPSGLNAGDKTGETWWTERIEGLQRKQLLDPAERLTRLQLLAREGPTKGKEPANWSVAFRPLRQLSPSEEADRRLKIAQADDIYMRNGAVMPEEVGVSRFGGDAFNAETTIDQELRGKMAPAPGDDEAALQLAAGGAPRGAGAVEPPKPAEAVDPSTALNGTQVTALLEIITAIAEKKLPRETGVATIAASFPLSPEEADAIVGEVGKSFFIDPPEPPPAPAGPPPTPKADGLQLAVLAAAADDRPPFTVHFKRDQQGRVVDATLTPVSPRKE